MTARVRALGRLAVAALAGAAAGVAFEPYGWAHLLPVAVAAMTVVCCGQRLRAGFGLGVVFGVVFMVVLLPWLQVIAVYAWLPLALLEGLFYGLAGLAVAALTRRPRPTRGWPLWAASAWVLVEALRSQVPFGGFPWGRLAFAVADTPVMPLVAYAGVAGTTFAVALVATTGAWAWTRWRATPYRAAAGLVLTLAAVSLASVLPWSATEAADRRVRVAAVQGDVPGQGMDAFSERRAVLDNHVRATQALAERVRAGRSQRPDLVVWPENSSDIDPYTDAAARRSISGAARAVGAPLLMGAVVGDRPSTGWRNRAIVWSGAGRMGRSYDKIHPVPFGEYIPLRSVLAPLVPALDQIPSDMIPGDEPGVLQVGPARAGVLLCFEVAYDGLVRDLVRGGADLIVVPSNNATYAGTNEIEQQFAMSRVRAVETGRYVVVASTTGVSGVIAPTGRVEARTTERTRTVVEQQVTLATGLTPAIRLGAWPERVLSGVAATAVLVVLLARVRVRRSRGGRARPGEALRRDPEPREVHELVESRETRASRHRPGVGTS